MKTTSKNVAVAVLCCLAILPSCKREEIKPTGEKTVSVSFRSPTGAVYRPYAIVASFDAPMVPLTAIGNLAKRGPISLDPPVPGSHRWLGTNTVSFVPAEPFPFASGFTVSIDPATLDIRGNSLKDAPHWSFETARPRMVTSQPAMNATEVERDSDILVRFNQPIDPAVAAKHMALTATDSDGREVKLKAAAQRPTDDEWKNESTERDRAVIVRPAQKLPLGSTITLTFDESLSGSEGPLHAGAPQVLSFKTHGQLAVADIPCTKNCDPAREIVIEFNNRVVPKEAMQHIGISPAVDIGNDAAWNGNWLELYGAFQPNTTYTVTLAAKLADIHGTTLGAVRTFTYTTGNYRPSLNLVDGFGVLEAHGPKEIALGTTNVSTVDVRFKPLAKDAVVGLIAKGSVFDTHEDPSDIAFAFERSIDIDDKPNQRIVSPLALNEGLGADGRGIVLIDVSSPQVVYEYGEDGKVRRERIRTLVQSTDIGITGKMYAGGALIWTTSLTSGKPLAGVAIDIRNKDNAVLWTGTTDERGMAHASIAGVGNRDTLYVFASNGTDIAFSISDWNDGFIPWKFRLGRRSNGSGLIGHLFTERGIYKPNETVRLKALIRKLTDTGIKMPARLSATIKATDSRGRTYFSAQKTVSAQGSTDADIVIPSYVAAGSNSIELTLNDPQRAGAELASFHRSFTVAQYRPAEFALTMNATATDRIAGDTVNVSLTAAYLFGEPMKDAAYDWSVYRSHGVFAPPDFDDYVFGTIDHHDERSQRHFGFMELTGRTRGRLDNAGSAMIAVPTTVGSVPATTDFTVETTVRDINDQTVSNRTAVTVHPGEFYIGLRTPSSLAAAGKFFNTSVIALNTKGAWSPNKNIKVTLFKREWHAVKKKEIVGYAYESTPVDKEVGECAVASKNEPVLCQLTPKSSGLHIIRATAVDARGNTVATESWLYATGHGEAAWEPDPTDRLDLVADKKSYVPGETARIVVKSPFERAHALITYERSGIMHRETTVLEGYAPTIDVVLTEDFAPNMYVSVVLVTGRVSEETHAWGPDEGRPRVKVGYLQIPVSAASKKLAVTVTPDKPKARPGDEVTVKVAVADPAGNPAAAEVTIMAVDRGSLILTDYATPDPFDIFYAASSLGVQTSDSRIHVIGRRHYGVKGQPLPAGGAEAAGERRAKFITVAYWNPALELDASGTAEVTFRLPDNLTTYTIMAVAATEDMFGSGDAEIVSSKPFMIRALLPHGVAVGDRFKAGVVIHNHTDAKLKGTVTTQATGLAIDGDEKQTFSVDPNGAQEVFFSYAADELTTATITYDASADGNTDGLELALPVRVMQPTETVAAYGETRDRAQELIEKPDSVIADVGGLDVSIAATALVGLTDASLYLITYPYECVEQRISRAFGIIAYASIAEALGMEIADGAQRRATVDDILFEMYRAQSWDGGIGFWPGMKSSPYLTIYALHMMDVARRAGFKPDMPVFDRAKEYVGGLMRWDAAKKKMDARYLGELKAYAAYVLALMNEADPGYHEKLYAARATLSMAARAQLALAIAYANGPQAWIDDFVAHADNTMAITASEAHVEEPDSIDGDLRADAYADAYVLMALSRARPTHPLIPKIARYLMGSARQGFWVNTHTTAAVLDSLKSYAQTHEREDPDFAATVMLGGTSLIAASFEGRNAPAREAFVPTAKLMKLEGAVPLVFEKKGSGRMFYRTRLTYAPLERPLKPREEGFTIFKRIEHHDTDKKGKAMKRGDIAKVSLEFVLPAERRYVVIEDGLPAGLEAIDFTLATARRQLASDSSADFPLNRVEIYGNRVMVFAEHLPAGSYRFDYMAKATAKGRFGVPPARIEQMYYPEVFGRTATGEIEIR